MAACTKVKPARFKGSGSTKNGSRTDPGMTCLGALLGKAQSLQYFQHWPHSPQTRLRQWAQVDCTADAWHRSHSLAVPCLGAASPARPKRSRALAASGEKMYGALVPSASRRCGCALPRKPDAGAGLLPRSAATVIAWAARRASLPRPASLWSVCVQRQSSLLLAQSQSLCGSRPRCS